VYQSCTKIVEVDKVQEVCIFSGANIDDWSILEGISCEWLILNGSNIDSAGLHYISGVKGLKKLSLQDCDSISSLLPLLPLDISFLDVDSCDGIESFPIGEMAWLKHVEAGYCKNVSLNRWTAYRFADSLDLEYLGIGFFGYSLEGDTLPNIKTGDTISGGSVDDSTYFKDMGVVYINEDKAAQKWYNTVK